MTEYDYNFNPDYREREQKSMRPYINWTIVAIWVFFGLVLFLLCWGCHKLAY